jgi:hypothetical protein
VFVRMGPIENIDALPLPEKEKSIKN